VYILRNGLFATTICVDSCLQVSAAVPGGQFCVSLIGFSPRDESPVSKLRVGEIEIAQFRWVTAPEVTPELAQGKIAEQLVAWIGGHNVLH